MSFKSLMSAALVAIAATTLAACSSEIDDKPAAQVREASATEDVNAASATSTPEVTRLQLDPAQSKIEFVGAKVTRDHRGSFGQYTGELALNADGSIAGLDVEVDTSTLQIEPAKLQGHLQSADFFDVEKFPSAVFTLTDFAADASGGGSHTVTGLLELHGVKNEIEFPATVDFGSDAVTATASFTINRKDFGIVYPGMPDDLIKDDVLLDLRLSFPKS